MVYIFIALLALVTVGCKSEEVFVREVKSDRITVEANRRGIDSNGGQVILNVTSNTYWVLQVDEQTASWIEFSPKAAPAGTTEVFVTIAENSDAARQGTLMFDTIDGIIEQVVINQRGADEQLTYYRESFGAQPVAEDTNINRFDGWDKTGFGSNLITYTGDVSISASNPSTVEGSSAGNSLYFGGDNLELVIGPIGIYGDEFFRFSFNVCNRNGALSTTDFKMWVGDNGKDYFPFNYRVENAAEGWQKVVADFSLKRNIATDIYLKLVAPAGYEIDDIVLVQGYAEDQAPMARVSMDSNPIGTIFFEDDLNWITPSFSNSYDGELAFAAGYSALNMYLHSNTAVPDESKQLWLEKGYLTPVDKGERTWNYSYVEVDDKGDGHFKIGRSSQSNARNHIGCFYLPKRALEKIDAQASISVLFSVDMGRLSVSDCNLVYISAITDGVEVEQEVAVTMDVIKTFGTFELRFDNVTRDTEFAIKTKVQADARSTRIYFDNFKITKL